MGKKLNIPKSEINLFPHLHISLCRTKLPSSGNSTNLLQERYPGTTFSSNPGEMEDSFQKSLACLILKLSKLNPMSKTKETHHSLSRLTAAKGRVTYLSTRRPAHRLRSEIFLSKCHSLMAQANPSTLKIIWNARANVKRGWIAKHTMNLTNRAVDVFAKRCAEGMKTRIP